MRMLKSEFLEESLAFGTDLVCQQRDSEKILFSGKFQDVFHQSGPVIVISVVRMNDHILQNKSETAHRR